MSGMDGMAMPGGWTLSMLWMRMPGQSWFEVAVAFIALWSAMMGVMMLPALLPMLRRYRRGVGGVGAARLAVLTTTVSLGYFSVWAAFGAAVFVPGALFAELALCDAALARAVPLLTAVMVALAGALQFTAWKMGHLACCRHLPRGVVTATLSAAWRHGLRLGWHCCLCCAGLTLMLLMIGMMDWRAMALVMAAIALERLAPDGRGMARLTGAIALGAGAWLMAVAAA